jgi:hypothetical protein
MSDGLEVKRAKIVVTFSRKLVKGWDGRTKSRSDDGYHRLRLLEFRL